MSTKTLRKRIALVAVASLGFGLMSTVPASAAVATITGATLAVKTGQTADPTLKVTLTGTAGLTPAYTITTRNSSVAFTNLQSVVSADYSAGATDAYSIAVSAVNTANGAALTNYRHEASLTTAAGAAGVSTSTRVLPTTFDDDGGTPGTPAAGISTTGLTATSAGAVYYIYIQITRGNYSNTADAKIAVTVYQTEAVATAAVLDTTQTSYAGRVGQQVTISPTGDITDYAGEVGKHSVLRVAAAITSQPAVPAGGAIVYPTISAVTGITGISFATTGSTIGTTATATSTGTAGDSVTVSSINYSGLGGATGSLVPVSGAAAAALGTITFTPTVAGTFTMVVWNESSTTGVASLSGTESYQTFTINVASGVGSVTLTPQNATAAAVTTNYGTHGSLVKVSIKDAAGNATTLAPGEFVTLTPTSGGIVKLVNTNAASSTAAQAYNLSAGDFDSTGTAWVNITNASAAEDIVTLTATTTAGVGSSTTLTFQPIEDTSAQPTAFGTSGFVATASNITGIPLGTSTITYRILGTTAEKWQQFHIIDTASYITGATITGLKWDAAVKGSKTATATVAAGTAYYAVKATVPGASQVNTAYSVNNEVGTTTANVARALVVANGVGVATPSNINAIVGSTNTVRVLLKDNFSRAYASQTLTATVTGKNPTVVAQSAVTDATGYATFTFVDANTNTASQDVITISGAISADLTVRISYGLNAVDKVVVDSGDTVAGVNALSATPADIAAGLAGAAANLATVTATVTNAAGAALSGVPVVFTVSGTGAAIPSNKITVYTDTTGVATSSVYGWVAGQYTVTATAGGKTGTGLQSFNQQTAAEVRTVSATVTGNSVTAVAKDRFGNPVVGATLYAIASGGASIGGSLVSSTPATDKNGSVTWIVTGSGSVKVTTINPSAVSTLATDQSTAAAGNHLGDVAAPVAFTATTVGTTVTAETGVGASFAPAGVSAVTVAVTADSATTDAATAAADAAAEATDAANAATDAANAAAEAADAATAAAQDAADAVAALSTSVSEMINALKKQITSLTNLVIKIQKKVRA
jgi:trimeric autotransporter adhesin